MVRGQSIRVDGVQGDLLGRLSIDRLTIEDAQGVWLSSEQVDLKWGPFALLFGDLNIKHLKIDELNIQRRPELLPSSTTPEDSPIKTYRVADLNLQRLNLANGIVGPAQSYALNGQLNAKDLAGQLSLDLRPTAAFGDEVRADIAWGGDVPVLGRVQIEGAPNGMIAALLQLPSGRAFSAELDASGRGSKWDVAANATVAAERVIDLRLTRDQDAYNASGTLSLTQIGRLESVRARAGDRIELSASVSSDETLLISANTDRGNIELSGILAERGETIRVEEMTIIANDLNASALSGLERLTLQSVHATGQLEVRDGDLLFNGDLSAPKFQYGNYGASNVLSRGKHAWERGGLVLATDWVMTDLKGLPQSLTNRLQTGVMAGLDGRYDVAEKRAEIDRFSIVSGEQNLSGNGSYDQNGAVDLSGDLALSDIAPLQTLNGAWRAEGASISNLSIFFEGEAVAGEQLESFEPAIGKRADLAIDIQRQFGAYLVRSASIRNQVMSATASGSLDNDRIDLEGDIAVGPLLLDAAQTAPIFGTFAIDGSPQVPRISATGRATGAAVAGEELFSPNLSAKAVLSPIPEFQLELEASYRNAPMIASLEGELNSGALSLSKGLVRWADLTANGSALIDTQMPSNSTFAVNISGSAPSVESVDGQISYAAEILDADLSISDTRLGLADMRSARLRASGEWPSFEGDLTYAGKIPLGRIEQTIQGSQNFRLEAIDQTLSLEGRTRFAEQEFEIKSPIEIGLAPSLTIQGALSAFGGDVELDFDPSGQSASQLRVINLEMGQLGALIQRPGVNGTLTGEANIAIGEFGLNGQGLFRVTDLSRGDSERANLDLRASVTNNRLTARLIANGREETLSLAGTLETDLTHDGGLASIRKAENAAVPVRLVGGGAIAPLWALAAPSDLRLEGLFDVDLSNGDGDDFRFTGPMSLQDGVFEDGFTGLHLEQIMAQIDLSRQGIALREANAKGSSGGTVAASGLYSFDGDGDIVLQLNKLDALNRSDVSAEVSGSARVDRRSRRTHVDGDLRVNEAKINLSELPGAGYTTLDVVFANPGEALTQEGPVREAVSLDLNLRADRRIFVTGPGIDTEWGLDARITGPLGAPQLAGQASLIRGEADLLSRSFRLTEGGVRFLGDPADSQLTLRADRTSDGITTSITLAGTAMDPEIELSSDPSLPDDEILARALFGRSPTNLSPLQAAQLAGAAAQLAGGDALSLTGQLEAATGLDRLDFGFDDEGGATLSTGKYLADDLYLEIESGGSGAPGVTLEWTPLSNVELDAEIDPELGPKVAIQWKRDFDLLPGEKRNEVETSGQETPARSSSNE